MPGGSERGKDSRPSGVQSGLVRGMQSAQVVLDVLRQPRRRLKLFGSDDAEPTQAEVAPRRSGAWRQ